MLEGERMKGCGYSKRQPKRVHKGKREMKNPERKKFRMKSMAFTQRQAKFIKMQENRSQGREGKKIQG